MSMTVDPSTERAACSGVRLSASKFWLSRVVRNWVGRFYMQFAGVEAPAETALNGKQTGDGRAVRVKLPFMEVTFCSRARTRSRIRSFFEGLANPGIKQQHDSSPF